MFPRAPRSLSESACLLAIFDGKANRRTHRLPPEGSQFLNGEPDMRNRLQVSFWGLHLAAGRHCRHRGSTPDRARVRFAIGYPILDCHGMPDLCRREGRHCYDGPHRHVEGAVPR
jgi:hypothetical protein